MKSIYILTIFLFIASQFNAQDLAKSSKDCSEFYKEYCFEIQENHAKENKESEINNREMILDKQSRAALFGKGDTAKLHMMGYKGQEYRLTFCAEEIFGGEALEYQIYQRKRELIDWKHYDDSVRAVENELARIDSIIQDSIFKAQEAAGGTEYEYYDNWEEEPYNDDFSTGSWEESTETVEVTPFKRPKFKVVKDMLYDNTKDGMSPVINFAAREENMSLIIEIKVPGEQPENSFKLQDRGCVGVLVEHVNISRTGF